MGVEVAYITHPACRDHLAGVGHPERPERLDAVWSGVKASGIRYSSHLADRADRDSLESVHDPSYLDALAAFSRDGGGLVDSDTLVDSSTWEAALRAAGAGLGAIGNGFEVAMLGVRPPGHHALAARAMGFCFLNNVVISAAALRQRGARVAVVDWDVHHGNGSQALLGDDPDSLYVSLHQSPFYPLTGHVAETGAAGTVVNLPLPAGTSGDVYRQAFSRLVVPIVDQFQPDYLLISSGFDAHEADPLAEMRLDAGDYGFMAYELRVALPTVPVVVFLEGGYDLAAIESSVSAMLLGFAGEAATPSASRASPDEAWGALEAAIETHSAFWRL
jgi:acetoin utilization deacetylase AcuC-like enzyme